MTSARLSFNRSWLKPFLAAAVAATLVQALAHAQTSSGEPLAPRPVASCVANDLYIVVSQSGDGPGNDIFARPAIAQGFIKSCAPGRTPGDFRVARSGEAKTVLALQGQFVIMDEGTGPSIRRLLVVDLARGSEVWSAQYTPEPKPVLSSHSLVFSKYLRVAGKNDCPNTRKIILQGLTPLYVVDGALSLPSLIYEATGQPRCIAGQ